MNYDTPVRQVENCLNQGQDYFVFNKQVYERFKEKFGSQEYASMILLNCGFTPQKKISKIPNDWHTLLSVSTEEVPKYLGMIAIQVGIAFWRQDNDEFTANAFNKHLQNYLRCNYLQSVYGTGQEEIYEQFGLWCIKHGLSIYLPETKTGPGRYVQYPTSLALLNGMDQEELKRCFGISKFSAYGDMDQESFWSKLEKLPDGIKRKKDGLQEKGELLKALNEQIYFIYLRWDGTYTEKEEEGGISRRSSKIAERKIFYMEFDQEQVQTPPVFFENDEPITDLPDKIINGSFFCQDDTYAADWDMVQTKSIDAEKIDSCAYVWKTDTDVSDDVKILTERRYCFDGINIGILKRDQLKELMENHSTLFGTESDLKLESGIQIQRKRCWAVGAGPIMVPENLQQDIVWLKRTDSLESKFQEIKISEQGLISLSRGKYCILFSNRRPAKLFEIAEYSREEELCTGGGWNCDHKNFCVCGGTKESDISGLDFSKIHGELPKNGNPVRQWMKLVAEENALVFSNESVIHQALRRVKNGICNRKS